MVNGRSSLHPRWSTHHVRTIDGFKTVSVEVVRRTDPKTNLQYNAATGTYTDAYTVIHTGIARIQPYGINLDIELANDPTARRLTLVQLQGKDLGIRTGDIVRITTSTNNPDLENYVFDVRGSLGSSVQWGTNLVTEANLKAGVQQ